MPSKNKSKSKNKNQQKSQGAAAGVGAALTRAKMTMPPPHPKPENWFEKGPSSMGYFGVLPPEIRIMIFRLVFGDIPSFVFIISPFAPVVPPPRPEEMLGWFPLIRTSLLHTSMSIYAEAVPFLYNQHPFRVPTTYLDAFLRTIPSQGRAVLTSLLAFQVDWTATTPSPALAPSADPSAVAPRAWDTITTSCTDLKELCVETIKPVREHTQEEAAKIMEFLGGSDNVDLYDGEAWNMGRTVGGTWALRSYPFPPYLYMRWNDVFSFAKLSMILKYAASGEVWEDYLAHQDENRVARTHM